jgi:hypothetical protein
MLVNDDSSIVNKLETSLIDDARVVIYDCHMFIVQVYGALHFTLMTHSLTNVSKRCRNTN